MYNWYLCRFLTMSVAEVFFRTKQFIKFSLTEKRGKKIKIVPDGFITKEKILINNSDYVGIKQNTLNFFDIRFDFNNPGEINWHKDVHSGEIFPSCFYRAINIRENPQLSAKIVWEINRLQFLTGVCMNFRANNNTNDLELFIHIIKSWNEQNPYLKGVNWYSNIEINLRLITWFFCWEILDVEDILTRKTNFRVFVENEWLPMIKQHCIYSYMHPSKHSSANNHLISEYAGLFIASSKWSFKESDKWLNYAQKGLENEIIKQHSENGVNKEEAAEYIQFITDFFLLSYIVGEKTNKPFSKQYKQQLYKIFCYIYDFLDIKGNFPKYGDEDDGKCFILDFNEKFNNFKSLLTSGAIIFKDSVLKSKSNGFDQKNTIIFGKEGKSAYESIPEIQPAEGSKFYKDEGHFIFRKKNGNREIYMHFDAAPLGFLSIAAHGHADALSLILHVNGQPVFADSGTYTYHTEPEWRRYFVGTLAHNTIRVNQRDQSVNCGPTLWIKHYKTTVIDVESNHEIERVKASHNGYSDQNIKHIREIIFNKISDEFLITDCIIIRKNKSTLLEIPFHLHPDVYVTSSGMNHFLISQNSGFIAEFSVDEKLRPIIINGQEQPFILGWSSDSFKHKDNTNVIYCRTQIESTTTFQFKIKIN